jgi:hypothetical protein
MHHAMGSRSMKSRAKTTQFGRTAERAPKSIRPSAAARKSVAPAAHESTPAPAARKSVAPAARKSMPPAARKSVPPQARKSLPPAALAANKKRPRASNKTEPADASSKRRLGMRGAAPWAARHAAKHAEEAAARNLSPPKPGSARGTLRSPDDADGIKQRMSELLNVLVRIRALRKNLDDNFFQIALELKHIHDEKLHEAKGFSSFEGFAERELDLGKATAVKLARVPGIFLEAAARQHGLSGVLAAIDALDEHQTTATQKKPSNSRANLPLKPPR